MNNERSDDPLLGTIMMFGGTFAPRRWAFCNGQLLSTSQYQSLFSILGTNYGGDGRSTFALPDLRGRVPIHSGNGNSGPGLRTYRLGQRGGRETNTLMPNELPAHNHVLQGLDQAGSGDSKQFVKMGKSDQTQPLQTQATGNGQAFNNMQPSLAVNYIISLEGIFPNRS